VGLYQGVYDHRSGGVCPCSRVTTVRASMPATRPRKWTKSDFSCLSFHLPSFEFEACGAKARLKSKRQIRDLVHFGGLVAVRLVCTCPRGKERAQRAHPTSYTLHPTPYTLHPTPAHLVRCLDHAGGSGSVSGDAPLPGRRGSGLGCRVPAQHARLRGPGLGFRVPAVLGVRVQGLGCLCQGARARVEG